MQITCMGVGSKAHLSRGLHELRVAHCNDEINILPSRHVSRTMASQPYLCSDKENSIGLEFMESSKFVACRSLVRGSSLDAARARGCVTGALQLRYSATSVRARSRELSD